MHTYSTLCQTIRDRLHVEYLICQFRFCIDCTKIRLNPKKQIVQGEELNGVFAMEGTIIAQIKIALQKTVDCLSEF